MNEFIQLAILGLALGALYSLSSQGLIIIYRGSGVLNFAQGAVGMVAAYVCWELSEKAGLPWAAACVLSLAFVGILGALIHLLVMRPLRKASSLSRIAATLGILMLLQGLVVLRYGADITLVRSVLPNDRFDIGPVSLTWDRVILTLVAGAMSILLWAVYKYTRFGLATSAVAENETIAASLGRSPNAIAMMNWSIGSMLAGAAAILVSPIVQLQPTTMTNLVIAALAPALVAAFRSFPIAFAAALGVGLLQTLTTRYLPVPGLGAAVPFIVIIAVLIFAGRSLPARDFFLQRLPEIGTGKVRLWVIALIAGVSALALVFLPPVWQDTFSICLGVAVILLSIVVLTGYTGQISLAQYAIAGMGAWIVARLDTLLGLPFLVALPVGILLMAPLGALLALPAARARGLNLAVATLGVGAAIEMMVFNNGALTGGASGVDVTSPNFFGFVVDPILNPGAYSVFALVMFTLAALAVAGIRRGVSGRRMVAVRTNERAAAALGISVGRTKVVAFALASSIAALGGTILAYRNDVVLFSEFTNLTSIYMVGWAMVGGVGFILGPLWGAQLAPSSVGTEIINTFWPHAHEVIAPIGGLLVILFLLQGEGGLSKANENLARAVANVFRRGKRKQARVLRPSSSELDSSATYTMVVPVKLEVRDVTVAYGNVRAVSDLSVTLQSGKVVGLIGPNGAGKTSAIDAITGFTKSASGSFVLNGKELAGLDAASRARAGIGRTFQSLELFEDMTVMENLRTASDPRNPRAVIRDLARPGRANVPPLVSAVVREFGLADNLDSKVSDLSLGKRRLVSIARAIACGPKVLLLDEPAAGLGDRESAELAKLVRRLVDVLGLAILLVEHDMNFVMSVCDEIVVLDFGKTICVGSPDVVRADQATKDAYLGGEDDGAEAGAPLAQRATSQQTSVDIGGAL